MSPLEVKEAYKGFKQENKSDKINLEKFTKMVASMNTNKGMILTLYNIDPYPTTYCMILCSVQKVPCL